MGKAAKKRWATMSKAEKNRLLDKMYKGKFGKRRPKAKKTAYKKSGGRPESQALYQARFEHKKKNPGVPMPAHLLLPQEKAALAAA